MFIQNLFQTHDFMKLSQYSALIALFASSLSINAETHVFDIATNKLGAEIPHTMYGIFFEDINYGADGGLYGELIKNRSFEFPQPFMGWSPFGDVSLQNDGPFERCPHYVRLSVSEQPSKWTGLQNEGYFGIGYLKDAEYRFTVWARVPNGGSAKFSAQLIDMSTMGERQQYLGETTITVDSKEWKKYEAIIKCAETIEKGSFRILLDHSSSPVDLEHISLFPKETYKGDDNGLRKDLAESLEQLHPGVFRFPGGCVVEGAELGSRYQWKNSVGPVENRPLNENRWLHSFDHRLFPDYFQSYGLGFYEYFRLAEEIGAEPLPVISVGLACQYQSQKHQPVDQLQSYIDDALDLIEFANGDPAKNKWAKIRAEMGHPAPFNLKYLAVGNEQWGEEYPARLKPFVEQIRAKYPNIQIIGSAGPDPEGEKFDYLWPEMRKLKVDLVDEHFYRNEEWFLKAGNRYDNYSRKGPKVFAGEYACHGTGKKWNHFNAALLEAAFMTNLERNADLVRMATYAPLFAHVEGWQWRPDAIWFNNTQKFNTCSYYVQQMYATNKGTHVLPLTMKGKPVAGNADQDGLFASAVFDKEKNEVIIKIVNTSVQKQSIKFKFKGASYGMMEEVKDMDITILHSEDLDSENSLKNPKAIIPISMTSKFNAKEETIIPSKTFMILKIKKDKVNLMRE